MLTTLKQSGCTFHFTNLSSGAAGIYYANLGGGGRLILTQANVNVTEAERAEDPFVLAGSVGQIVGGFAVLTQTSVNINLNASDDAPRQEGAAFQNAISRATITLRLFSGTSNVNACGFYC